MSRVLTIVAVIGLLVGVLGGFLYWGLPERRLQGDLRRALERPAALEHDLEESRRQTTKLEGELQGVRGRLKTLEDDLAREREQRAKLEALVSRGRK